MFGQYNTSRTARSSYRDGPLIIRGVDLPRMLGGLSGQRSTAMTKEKCCATCGHLCSYKRGTNEFLEVDDAVRSSGVAPKDDSMQDHEFPICFAMAEPLKEEVYSKAANQRDRVPFTLRVIQANRDNCRYYTKWQWGHSPKEHYTMIHTAELESSRNKWQLFNTLLSIVFGALAGLVVNLVMNNNKSESKPIINNIVLPSGDKSSASDK
jgi:Fe-S-cluster containining protein